MATIDVENRNKNESVFRIISDLKNEIQGKNNQFKNFTKDLNQLKADKILLKTQLDQNNIHLEETNKHANQLFHQNEELINEGGRTSSFKQTLLKQNHSIQANNENLNIQIIDITNTINDTKDILGLLNAHKKSKYARIGDFEEINNNLDIDIINKIKIEQEIRLQCRKKEDLNNQQAQKIMELEEKLKKLKSQIHQKSIKLKQQNQKGFTLSNQIKMSEMALKKYQNSIDQEESQSRAIDQENTEILDLNTKLTSDRDSCQLHLKNLVDQNEFINNELNKFSEQSLLTLQIMMKKRVSGYNEFNRISVKNYHKQKNIVYVQNNYTPKKKVKEEEDEEIRQTTI